MLSIDPATIAGLISLITSLATAIVTVIVAVRQNTTNRVIRRVEIQSNSMSERLENTAYAKGKAEEQVKQAADVVKTVAANVAAGAIVSPVLAQPAQPPQPAQPAQPAQPKGS